MGDTGRIGPYVLRGELGRGAMARVWRAWDPNLEREVAIKEPLFDPSLPEAVLAEMGRRFVAEGRAAARLSHPNVVAIYAADVWEGRPAIVMELVEGSTLSELLRRGPVPAAQALAILDQLLDAVGYAHARGVVHRDIKPDNVFVTHDGTVKLADFGIARVDAGAATRATVAGSVLGTPGYMSPEQARGEGVDARSDLFSVGVVAHEMLSGSNPFGSGEPTALLYRIVYEPAPELPASACAGLPADLRPAIMAALAKDPADRPQTAEAFKAMLHGEAAPVAHVVPDASVTAKHGAVAYTLERNGGAHMAASSSRATSSARSWLPYAIVAGVAVLVLGFVLASALRTGGGTVTTMGTGAAVDDVTSVAAEVVAKQDDEAGAASLTQESRAEGAGSPAANAASAVDVTANKGESQAQSAVSSQPEGAAMSQQSQPAPAAAATPEPEPAPEVAPEPRRRYEVVRDDVSWTDARAECERRGGHLVTITSAEENAEVVSLVAAAGLQYAWLGAYITRSGDQYVNNWVTGEPFSYSAWSDGEPSHVDASTGIEEMYVELWHFKSTDEWSWNDDQNSPHLDPANVYMPGNMGYVCEYE